MGKKILIIDDEKLMREYLEETLKRLDYKVTTARDGAEGLEKVIEGSYDLVITDIKMPKVGGMEILRKVKEVAPTTDVIMMTAYGTIESAVEAMKVGAYDYLSKPFSPDAIEVLVEKAFAWQKILLENEYLKEVVRSNYDKRQIVGEHKTMKQLFKTIKKVALSKATVLICGDSGTGKELIAGAIHYQSERAEKAFIKVNCAALSEHLLESELFGHEKGAFTGAVNRRIGRFELADGGTLLLDEISEISPKLQAKLLRVLQEREFERVGGSETITVDVRIIATTNRDLTKEVERGTFREDLFFRLNVIPIELAPLRERGEDIPGLVEFFIGKHNLENNTHYSGIDDKALLALKSYHWPGNIRELENVIERAVVLGNGKEIRWVDLPSEIKLPVLGRKKMTFPVGTPLRDVERELILRTYNDLGQHRQKTADILGISPRKLFDRLKEYEEE